MLQKEKNKSRLSGWLRLWCFSGIAFGTSRVALAPLPRWTFRPLDRQRIISLVGPFLLSSSLGGDREAGGSGGKKDVGDGKTMDEKEEREGREERVVEKIAGIKENEREWEMEK